MRHLLAILFVVGCARHPAPQPWNPDWIASPAERRWHEGLGEIERQAIYEAVLAATPRITGRTQWLTGVVLDSRISASVSLAGRSNRPPSRGEFEWYGAHSAAWLAKLEDMNVVAGVCRAESQTTSCVAESPKLAVVLSVIAPYGRKQGPVMVRVEGATTSGAAGAAAGWDVLVTKDQGQWRVTDAVQTHHTFGWP